jgi:hypothetical protein
LAHRVVRRAAKVGRNRGIADGERDDTFWQTTARGAGWSRRRNPPSWRFITADHDPPCELGLWLGLERTDLAPGQRRTIWLAIMVPLTLWAAVAWTAAIDGVFRTGASPLPLLPSAIFLPVIIGAPLLLLSKRVGHLLDAMQTTWLVALQLYRVFGSQWLAYWLRGLLPGLWALPAGTGDVLTGLFAVPAAIALATGTAEGRKAAMLWNIFGIADLAVAITLGMIIAPGPFQLIVPDGPSLGIDGYPNVLTPAFVVPGSILLHALSLRQLRRRRRAEAARR